MQRRQLAIECSFDLFKYYSHISNSIWSNRLACIFYIKITLAVKSILYAKIYFKNLEISNKEFNSINFEKGF